MRTIDQLIEDTMICASLAHMFRQEALSLHKNGLWYAPGQPVDRVFLRTRRMMARRHEQAIVRYANQIILQLQWQDLSKRYRNALIQLK